MRALSKIEEVRYNSLHDDLKRLFDETRKSLELEPVIDVPDILLVCGERNEQDQELAFKRGVSKVHFPNSKHNKSPSEAMDIAPYPLDWNNTQRFYHLYERMKQVALENKIAVRFGADFNMDGNLKNDKFVDLPHVELINAV